MKNNASPGVLPGYFISIEGGEGAGKTTLIQGLTRHLQAKGNSVLATREPGGTPEAEAIREMLVRGAVDRWDAISETALFMVARRQHVQQKIKPALNAGSIVLCDRFIDSTRVYQGHVKSVPQQTIEQLSQHIVGSMTPHLTLLVDIDPKIGLKRTQSRSPAATEDRFEAHGLEFHQGIRSAFLIAAKNEPRRIKVLDGTLPPEALCKAACTIVDEHIIQHAEANHG